MPGWLGLHGVWGGHRQEPSPPPFVALCPLWLGGPRCLPNLLATQRRQQIIEWGGGYLGVVGLGSDRGGDRQEPPFALDPLWPCGPHCLQILVAPHPPWPLDNRAPPPLQMPHEETRWAVGLDAGATQILLERGGLAGRLTSLTFPPGGRLCVSAIHRCLTKLVTESLKEEKKSLTNLSE